MAINRKEMLDHIRSQVLEMAAMGLVTFSPRDDVAEELRGAMEEHNYDAPNIESYSDAWEIIGCHYPYEMEWYVDFDTDYSKCKHAKECMLQDANGYANEAYNYYSGLVFNELAEMAAELFAFSGVAGKYVEEVKLTNTCNFDYISHDFETHDGIAVWVSQNYISVEVCGVRLSAELVDEEESEEE